jgi:ABC-type polysaccharide/polyol phosphate export permease
MGTIQRSLTDYFCLGKKFLVYNMVGRNIKSKYGRSFIGLGWTLLSPMMLAAIYYLVFKQIMRVQMTHYLTFVLSGVLPWTFFAQCVMEGMESIVGNESLVTQIPVPLQILPLVNSTTNLITLSAAVPVILAVSIFQGVTPGWHSLFVFYFFGILFLLAYSLALILSVGYVIFRDLRHVMTLFLQLWMFGTPVIYSVEMVPERYRPFLHLNPVTDAISGLHQIFTQGIFPSSDQMIYSALWAVVSTVIAMFFMRTSLRNVVEKL